MTAFFGFILALLKAIPILKSSVDQFIAWYVERELAGMKVENAAAIKRAIVDKDQRDLEKALGNPDAGEPSNTAGAELRDHLPGVPDSPAGQS